MPLDLKHALLRSPWIDAAWTSWRRHQLAADYSTRREHYARVAAEQGVVYDEDAVCAAVRRRLAARGHSVRRRPLGEIHTFAYVPRIGWHAALYPDLETLGPVSEFDYAALGYTCAEFVRGGASAVRRRREMLAQLLPAVRRAHAERPIDWVFVYASGVDVTADAVRAIVDEIGVPVVNMCLDDKQSWSGPVFDGQRTGQIDIAHSFDVSWTSARVACEWYLCEGARPIYMPEGFDPRFYRPMPVTQDVPVSFVGGAYGFRPSVIRHVKRAGIPIRVYGPGWGTESVWGERQVEVINRSRINLGMGGIGYSESLTNVKTRDFEIPGTGGGMYLTSFNPDLAQHFEIGREIVCYRNREELVELLRYYLARPDDARAIAERGRARCLAEHRWLHRYLRICQALGIADDATVAAGRTATQAEAA